MTFQIGDAVKVKSGTEDPDFGIDIGSWQGWISEIDGEIICITWDSITLSKFPASIFLNVKKMAWTGRKYIYQSMILKKLYPGTQTQI